MEMEHEVPLLAVGRGPGEGFLPRLGTFRQIILQSQTVLFPHRFPTLARASSLPHKPHTNLPGSMNTN